MTDPEIRVAELREADGLSPLLEALGYPAAAELIERRLQRLAANPNAIVLVASVGLVVEGVATAHMFDTIHAEAPAAWITALVVSTAVRRRGVGSGLVRALERWARERGAIRISVNSGLHRADAHSFYEGLGYAPNGKRFSRTL